MIELNVDSLTHLRVMQLESQIGPDIEQLLVKGCTVKELIELIAAHVDTPEELAFFCMKAGELFKVVNQIKDGR